MTKEFHRDRSAGAQVLYSYCNSTFTAWSLGSTLILRRWTDEFQIQARDGFPSYSYGNLPRNKKEPRPIPIEQTDLFFSKLRKFIIKNYITRESTLLQVLNKVDYFAVPKGDTDIRPVFNGISCGLNKRLWAPKFWLPTADSLAQTLTFNYQMVDIDLGEMFNNSPLHWDVRMHSGLDLTLFHLQTAKEFPNHLN